MKVFIYGLFDPRTKRLRYVGKTNDVHHRHINHCNPVNKGNKSLYTWLCELRDLGKKPKLKVLKETDEFNWRFDECLAISKARARHADLLNIARGGGSWAIGKQYIEFSPAHRKALSDSKKLWYKNNPEKAKAIGRLVSKHLMSLPAEERQERSRSGGLETSRLWKDPEWKAAHSAAVSRGATKRWSNPEAKEHQSEKMKAAWENPPQGWLDFVETRKGNQDGAWKRTDEDKERLRNLTKGRKAGPEELKRRSDAQKERYKRNPMSEEIKKRISEKNKKWTEENPEAAAEKAAKMRKARLG